MGAVRQARWLRANSVPPLGTRVAVDLGHPLAMGLVSLYLPGRDLVDLCGVGPTLAYTGGPTQDIAARGPAMRANATGERATSSSLPAQWRVTSGTIFWWQASLGAPSNFATWFGIDIGNGLTGPFVNYVLGPDGSANVSFAYSDGTNSFNRVSSTTAGSSVTTAAATWTVNGAIAIYANGNTSTIASGTWVNGAPNYNSPTINIGGNASFNLNADIYCAMLFNRALSASEYVALHNAPLQMLIPAG